MDAARTLGRPLVVHDDPDRPPTRQRLLDDVRGAAALITLLTERVDAELLDAAGPGLRIVANCAVGYDNVDVAAAAERGVVVTNTPGVLDEATADVAFGLILVTTWPAPAAPPATRWAASPSTTSALSCEASRRSRRCGQRRPVVADLRRPAMTSTSSSSPADTLTMRS